MAPEKHADWSVREYDAANDSAMVREWARAHGTEFVEALLSPVGVVACRDGVPQAVAWMYLCVGVGVGYIDRVFTAGGLALGEARAALMQCVEALRAVARAHDTGVLYSFVPPALAKNAAGQGLITGHQDLVQLIILT